jgi:hypothetical protein
MAARRQGASVLGVAVLFLALAGCARPSASTEATGARDVAGGPERLDCPEPAPLPGAFQDDIVLTESMPGEDPDAGRGTGTLCVGLTDIAPIPVAVDCGWSADRRHVLRVGALPAEAGGRTLTAGIDVREATTARVDLSAFGDVDEAYYVAGPGEFAAEMPGTGAD